MFRTLWLTFPLLLNLASGADAQDVENWEICGESDVDSSRFDGYWLVHHHWGTLTLGGVPMTMPVVNTETVGVRSDGEGGLLITGAFAPSPSGALTIRLQSADKEIWDQNFPDGSSREFPTHLDDEQFGDIYGCALSQVPLFYGEEFFNIEGVPMTMKVRLMAAGDTEMFGDLLFEGLVDGVDFVTHRDVSFEK